MQGYVPFVSGYGILLSHKHRMNTITYDRSLRCVWRVTGTSWYSFAHVANFFQDLALGTSLSAFWFPSLVISEVFILKAVSVTKFHGSHASYQIGILFPPVSLSVQTHFLIFHCFPPSSPNSYRVLPDWQSSLELPSAPKCGTGLVPWRSFISRGWCRAITFWGFCYCCTKGPQSCLVTSDFHIAINALKHMHFKPEVHWKPPFSR